MATKNNKTIDSRDDSATEQKSGHLQTNEFESIRAPIQIANGTKAEQKQLAARRARARQVIANAQRRDRTDG